MLICSRFGAPRIIEKITVGDSGKRIIYNGYNTFSGGIRIKFQSSTTTMEHYNIYCSYYYIRILCCDKYLFKNRFRPG